MSDSDEGDFGTDGSSEEESVDENTNSNSKSNSNSNSNRNSSNSKKRKKSRSTESNKKAKKKLTGQSLIDDSAIHSGSEDENDDDDEEEEDETEINDYERDGFVVDEIDDDEVQKKKKSNDDLSDSDDDEDDDDDDDEDGDDDNDEENVSRQDSKKQKLKRKKIRKMNKQMELLEDDLDLIRESRGEAPASQKENDSKHLNDNAATIRAKDAQGVQNQLFMDDDEDDMHVRRHDSNRGISNKKKKRHNKPKKNRYSNTGVDYFDEDDMDGFIDDDMGDQEDMIHRDGDSRSRSRFGAFQTSHLTMDDPDDQRSERIKVSQLEDAVDIFGAEYLETMQQDDDEDEDDAKHPSKRYREKGVGVDLGVDSDIDIVSEDEIEEDLFQPSDDDDEDGEHARKSRHDKAEAARLRKQMRELRRKTEIEKRNEARKARLRKAFEPVQLAENFCTDKDDKIRMKDIPERFFDWNVPFHEKPQQLQEEAMWIMTQVPQILAEYTSPVTPKRKDMEEDEDEDDEDSIKDPMERKQKQILESIKHALQYMHKDKLEPQFIKRYRADIVTSPAVRDHLYDIFDQDAKFERLASSRIKVSSILNNISKTSSKEEQKTLEETSVETLKEELNLAQEKLDDALKKEQFAKKELQDLNDKHANDDNNHDDTDDDDDDDDDDELFGKSNSDETDLKKKEQKKNKEREKKSCQ